MTLQCIRIRIRLHLYVFNPMSAYHHSIQIYSYRTGRSMQIDYYYS